MRVAGSGVELAAAVGGFAALGLLWDRHRRIEPLGPVDRHGAGSRRRSLQFDQVLSRRLQGGPGRGPGGQAVERSPTVNGRSMGSIWFGFAAASTAAAAVVAAAGLLAAGRTNWVAARRQRPRGMLGQPGRQLGGSDPALPRDRGRRSAVRPAGPSGGRDRQGEPVSAAGTLLAGGGAAVFGGWQRRSLLLSVAVSYVLLLAIETWMVDAAVCAS